MRRGPLPMLDRSFITPSYRESPTTGRHGVDDCVFGSDGSITNGPDARLVVFVADDTKP